MESGSTEPALCKCDDGALYVIKTTASVPRKQLIHELVASSLARCIGLPIPDFAVVYISDELVEYLPPSLKGKLCAGYAFASLFIPNSTSISFNDAHKEIDLDKQKMIYLFDRVTNNSDRSLSEVDGNVNIIYNVKKQNYYLIDHNLAFDASCTPTQFAYHVYSPRHRKWSYDMVDVILIEDTIEILNEKCHEFLLTLPSEWIDELSDKDHIIQNVIGILARGKDALFRSSIT
ncbi:HipA family kinase [Moellerella wisconsensis]|uniref:Uncharacterized protein n=2 Tax=Moellerella wisconsensis TaxID=158849 RepID=A0ACD3YBZ1_9GAMM|nr:HipA family kinase [Moellerella wisconsensis]UNH39944.1 hypothetical protein MNY70_05740 [Moellerella wisconsensis]